MALVLGCALLWLVWEDCDLYIPNELHQRVWLAYRDTPGRTLPLIENPIKRVLLLVTGDAGEVYIDELVGDDNENEDGSDNAGSRTRQRIERDEIQALQSQVAGL